LGIAPIHSRERPSFTEGLDIGAPAGTPILASADGVVTVANSTDSWGYGYGYHVKIKHNETCETLYAHCSNIAVAILELDSSNFDMHEYTKSVRKLKDDRYLSAFEKYEEKYDINGYRPKEETEKRIIEPKEK